MPENQELPKTRGQARALNSIYYFSGKPCMRGHISKRQTSNGYCFSCYRLKHKPKSEVNQRIYSDQERKQRQKNRSRIWYEKNRELCIKRAAKWKKENPEKVRESEARERQKPKNKAITFMRDSLRRVLKTEKKGRTEKLLGYTRLELIAHLERQFVDGMKWSNHGTVWEIDHITPVSEMINNGETNPAKINCLSNLRPIGVSDNRQKKDTMEFLL